MAGAQVRVRLNLERNLAFLGTVGNNAPFVGLFGTVIGIIQAFDKPARCERSPLARPPVAPRPQVRGAAAGDLRHRRRDGHPRRGPRGHGDRLLVAIPAVAAYNFFQRKVKSIVASTDTITHVVTASLASKGELGTAPRRARPNRPPPRSRAPAALTQRRRAETTMAGGAQQDDDGSITGINVTPFVDIALVLLIIFMVTAKYIVTPQAIPVDLPRASTGSAVSVGGGDQRRRAAQHLRRHAPRHRAELVALMRDQAPRESRGAGHHRRDSQRVDHGRVVQVIDLVRQAGVSKFAIQTQLPGEGSATGAAP
jgi:biopolymer transport protein ExbD